MGRRAIYKTAEEKIEARRQQNRKHVRAFRARKAVNNTPRKWSLPHETLLTQSAVRLKDSQIDDDDEFMSECVTKGMELPECRALLRSSAAAQQAVPAAPNIVGHYRRPRDQPVDYTISLMNSLFEDFLGRANFDNKDKPRIQQMKYSRLVNPHPTLALCAVMVGWSRGDKSLIRLASESYHHALQFVRRHTADAYLKSSALTLVIAVADLCSYELAVLFRKSHNTKPSPAAWSRHFDAGQRIIEYAGPHSFTSDLARQTILVSVRSIIARALAQRTSTFLASPEWCSYLEAMPGRAHADRLWPVVLKIPGLMQQADILGVNVSNPSDRLIPLQQIDEIDKALDFWLGAYEQDESDDSSAYWSSTAPPKVSEAKFPPSIDFGTTLDAEVMMTYWAYKLELSMLREDIGVLHITTLDRSPSTDTSRTSSHDFASLIGRSIAYWLKYVSTEVCLFRLLYAVRVAWAWFARFPESYHLELCACRAFRSRMQSAPKTRMAEFVMDLFYKPPPD